MTTLPWQDVMVDVQGPFTRGEGGEQYVLSYHDTKTRVPRLAAFQKLQSLTLNYNRLTDASAEWLKGFKHLKFLNLKGNLISDDVKAKLIEAMPYTTVNT